MPLLRRRCRLAAARLASEPTDPCWTFEPGQAHHALRFATEAPPMLRGVRITITSRAGLLALTCNAERDDPGGEQIRALARELMEDADRMCRA